MQQELDERTIEMTLASIYLAYNALEAASEHMRNFISYYIPQDDDEALLILTMQGALTLMTQMVRRLYDDIEHKYRKGGNKQ